MTDEAELSRGGGGSSSDEETIRGEQDDGDMAEPLFRPTRKAPVEHGGFTGRYRQLVEAAHREEAPRSSSEGSTDALPRRAGSPIDSLASSVPDDSASARGSIGSSPGSNVRQSVALRPGRGSPAPSFRPFDRRFSSRISSPVLPSPRSASPALLAQNRSRNVSLSSTAPPDAGDRETRSAPWEVVRWTRLSKLNAQAFSEIGKRNFGSPTCIAVSNSIVLGTSNGIILVFDYHQNLKMILGPGTKAVEAGAVSAIAVSADHTIVAGGHASGSIFTWDTSRASRPFLSIPHLHASDMAKRTADGHLPNVAVTHLGFLGMRHTALVSADDRGMAFSHLATRGTGALGRTVKTRRILGRYPDSKPPASGKVLRPSTVLAFAALPLGNVETATDTMGLTAMLTPYLVVVVSTTPIAQTQHKAARPKELAAHSTMSGCLAWFPAVKLKVAEAKTDRPVSRVKLVYCWSNVLTVLDVDEVVADDKDKPPSLGFRARSRWKCEEAIVAVQWLGRSVLTVLTVSQRLVVLEDPSLRVTETFDLLHKHIYHADLFSKQLHRLVEQLDEEDPSMHGVVADAFSMSFKAYKGRLFLLGFNDVSIGALSNWADRLIALMEMGDYIGAIRLATSYYTGDADTLTVGLPEDAALRHSIVHDKLVEMTAASLKFAFGQRKKRPELADDDHLRELAKSCFVASASIGDICFVFDAMYEWYEDAAVAGIFVETLEPYILQQTITLVPPVVVKAMVAHFVGKGWERRLETMLCHMDTATLDVDQTMALCKQHGLHDALIYIWNQAIRDFITPLIDLLELLVPSMQNGDCSGSSIEGDQVRLHALKLFPYLSSIWTGRVYPTGDSIAVDVSAQAKAELYWFFFSGKSITWPKDSQRRFLTKPSLSQEPSFPYLRLLLQFDAPSLLSVMNEAFEDSFLNNAPEAQMNGRAGTDRAEEIMFGATVNRQYVLSVLIEIMNPADFGRDDTIYLDMFVARNMAKYPQYLLLPGSMLTKTLRGLCNYPADDLADDAQLSAEYLLSVYQPADLPDLMPLFKKAGFFRILKRIYRNDKQYGMLIQTYLDDPVECEAVFGAIADCLRPGAGLARRQAQAVHQVIRRHARQLVTLEVGRAASTMAAHAPELHQVLLKSLQDEPQTRFQYLETLFGSGHHASSADRELVEQYVQLMCRFAPDRVAEYVGLVQSACLRPEIVLPTMEQTGAIDAAVVLMVRVGQVDQAMARLLQHLGTLEAALQGLFAGSGSPPDAWQMQHAAEELLGRLLKHVLVGTWLCQRQTETLRAATPARQRGQRQPLSADALATDEALWLELIDTTLHITRRLSATVLSRADHLSANEKATRPQQIDSDKLLGMLRSTLQHAFTALLTATSTPGAAHATLQLLPPTAMARTAIGTNLSFVRVLRAFLSRAASASPHLADLRAVLSSVFSAYAYEESILKLASRLLEHSLFVSVGKAVQMRQRGWRPKGSTCEACGKRVWGPGANVGGHGVWEAWERKRERGGNPVRRPGAARGGRISGRGSFGELIAAQVGPGAMDEHTDKGKGKAVGRDEPPEPPSSSMAADRNESASIGGGADTDASGQKRAAAITAQSRSGLGPLVILACKHIYHQSCLEALQAELSDVRDEGGRSLLRCPIDT